MITEMVTLITPNKNVLFLHSFNACTLDDYLHEHEQI